MAYTANRHLARCKRTLHDFDPDSTAATVVAYQSLVSQGGAEAFVAGLFRSVGTGSVTIFRIVAATSTTGAGKATVVSHAIGSAPNAVGDYIWLEASAEQIRAALAGAKYASAEISLVTSTDECVVLHEVHGAYVADSETADYIS